MAVATQTKTRAATTKKPDPKKGVPPSKVQREQAKLRREAVRDGLPKHEAKLTPFAERFCHEFLRCGVIEDAHRATELALNIPLDVSGYDVEYEETTRTVKGRKVDSRVMVILDNHGRTISEADLRLAQASNIYVMPEVKQRIRDLRAEAASAIRVTAESIALQLDQVVDNATRDRQHQVVANCLAMKAKVFGVDAGSSGGGGGDQPTPTATVEVRIRDFTGKPAPRED